MNGTKLLALGAVVFLASNAVTAAVSHPFGWYLEGNVGKSYTHKIFPGTVKNTGLGWNINGGYKFTKFVAVDVGYTSYADARVQNPAGTTVATDSHYSYDIAAKLMLPISTTGLELFVKGGINRIHSYTTLNNAAAANAYGYVINTGTHSINGAYYGAGASYAIMAPLAVNIQWMRANGSRTTGRGDLASGGLSYIF